MSRAVAKVDAQGFYLEDVLLEDGEEVPEGCVGARPLAGLHRPKWTGSEWAEGKPEAEILEEAKAQKIGEFAGQGIADLEPLFTRGVGRDETMLLLASHVLSICEALNVPADPRLAQVVEVGEKALAKKAAVEAATTLEELEGIAWTP